MAMKQEKAGRLGGALATAGLPRLLPDMDTLRRRHSE